MTAPPPHTSPRYYGCPLDCDGVSVIYYCKLRSDYQYIDETIWSYKE